MTMLTRAALKQMQEHRRRAALRRLLRLNDAVLADMGWRRDEIEAALRLPLDRNAAEAAWRRSGALRAHEGPARLRRFA